MSNHVNCCKILCQVHANLYYESNRSATTTTLSLCLDPHDAQHVLGILAFDHRGHLGTSQVQEALDVQVIGRKDQFKQNLPS